MTLVAGHEDRRGRDPDAVLESGSTAILHSDRPGVSGFTTAKECSELDQDGFRGLVALPEIYAGDGKGGFVRWASLRDVPASGRYALVVDVNGDGKSDVVVSDLARRLTVWLNNTERSPRPPRRG